MKLLPGLTTLLLLKNANANTPDSISPPDPESSAKYCGLGEIKERSLTRCQVRVHDIDEYETYEDCKLTEELTRNTIPDYYDGQEKSKLKNSCMIQFIIDKGSSEMKFNLGVLGDTERYVMNTEQTHFIHEELQNGNSIYTCACSPSRNYECNTEIFKNILEKFTTSKSEKIENLNLRKILEEKCPSIGLGLFKTTEAIFIFFIVLMAGIFLFFEIGYQASKAFLVRERRKRNDYLRTKVSNYGESKEAVYRANQNKRHEAGFCCGNMLVDFCRKKFETIANRENGAQEINWMVDGIIRIDKQRNN